MSIATIKNPDEIQCTLEFTMKLKDWKQIRKTLSTNPCYTELQIMNDIGELVIKLEKTLYANI